MARFGDIVGTMTEEDYVELQRELRRRGIVGGPSWPIKVGECMYVRTVTHYAVGRIKEIGPDYFLLDDASSIAHEGRRSESLQRGFIASQNEGREYVPEIESCPDGMYLGIMRASIVDFVAWPHPLPRKPQ